MGGTLSDERRWALKRTGSFGRSPTTRLRPGRRDQECYKVRLRSLVGNRRRTSSELQPGVHPPRSRCPIRQRRPRRSSRSLRLLDEPLGVLAADEHLELDAEDAERCQPTYGAVSSRPVSPRKLNSTRSTMARRCFAVKRRESALRRIVTSQRWALNSTNWRCASSR